MEFTGERMVPHRADPATEMYHWQRYLFFRPWYAGRKVLDAASGEGYGTGYAAAFAESAVGIDVAADAVAHAQARYPRAHFAVQDVATADYAGADLVVSFETIEHLPDPLAFLTALRTCSGTLVVSTPNRNSHSPGNSLSDKPWNEYHTVEWTPTEFRDLVEQTFPDRTVRMLSQEERWPGRIVPEFRDDARYAIAVIGDLPTPVWPRIGLAMPTVDQPERVCEAVLSLARSYPGELTFAVVANGSSQATLEKLRELRDSLPHVVELIESPENLGYGRGANIGLTALQARGGLDLYGVTNDDVLPATDCVCQMVESLRGLSEAGYRPGIIGPYSNEVSGAQRLDLGPYRTYEEMLLRAEAWHDLHHSGATQAVQVRGLFALITPECLEAVGGFDPRFGLGNFEDDDHNLRCRLAGFSLWLADGAFLHHHGSSTFRNLKLNYDAIIARNHDLICQKWRQPSFEAVLGLTEAPDGVSLHVPLDAALEPSGHAVNIDGERIDLVHQASDVEFAAYLIHTLRSRPRADRVAVLEALDLAG